ncbi:hypothetical protein [Pedobacter sandarakinus]|uniref:hypothetical protein n=1 Tax=Pedobacter sandarakinus TaxID=353156 RepID=UPI002246A2DA|nr:hypothetical protein [Pedobacter sandarakinus]MCX2574049.1 hypothetical protein [Pedobacter sandarakinus]
MVFIEKQGLKIWWLYLIAATTIFPTVAIALFYNGGMGWNELTASYFAPIWAGLIPFALIYLLAQCKLTLKIDDDGVSYRYALVSWKLKYIPWREIDKAYIRKYDAFSEYGGYGVRYRLWFKLKDKAYLLNDHNMGLQLELKNDLKVLFSSNKIEELNVFLVNLKKEINIQAIQQ